MPRYYFDIREGDRFAPDDEGLELTSLQAVQGQAARSLADLARDVVRDNKLNGVGHQMAIEVRDDSGRVFEVKLSIEIDQHKD